MPGHTNAALARTRELNCDGVGAAAVHRHRGRLQLAVRRQGAHLHVRRATCIGELAALTPGPYLHIGGDEADATTAADYTHVHEPGPAHRRASTARPSSAGTRSPRPTTPTDGVAQFWGTGTTDAAVAAAARRGNKVIMSPANKAYLDMKYDQPTPARPDAGPA